MVNLHRFKPKKNLIKQFIVHIPKEKLIILHKIATKSDFYDFSHVQYSVIACYNRKVHREP